MASGLSAAILVAVMILQPGKGKHDTTAQIPAAPAQTSTPSQTQIAKTDPRASFCLFFVHTESRRSRAGIGREDRRPAGTELPVLPGGPDTAAGKSQANSPGNDQGLPAEAKAEPAPCA